MLYNYINKDQLEQNANLEGYYKYDIDENTSYIGKINNSKRNGYGTIYQNDQVIWEGMWMNDHKIDDVLLPNEVPIDESELVLDSCQKLVFHINALNHNFKLTYSVPSVHMYDLDKVINKAINHANYYNNKNISVNVHNSKCNLSNDIIHKLLEIDNVINYVTYLDSECSSCIRFNRSWKCCGQFAPFIYMYHFLLYENKYETYYKNRFGQTGLKKPSQVYNIANVFYKMFTGYANNTIEYNQMRDDIRVMYNTNIPNHFDSLRFWSLDYFDELENNKSYLLLLTNKNNVAHYCYIYIQEPYVILCDSWSHDSDKRGPISRIINYSEFIKCITKINTLYNKMMVHIDSDTDYSKLLLLYNFILDSLFLVPYNKSDIDDSTVTFYRELYYVTIIDPKQVRYALNKLDQNSVEPFNMYLRLGGSMQPLVSRKKNTKHFQRITKKNLQKGVNNTFL
jgi:hypothetical protein